MSVFKRLLTLFPNTVPQEDFFSEVVAHTFITRRDILLGWLEHLGLIEPQDVVEVRVATQYTMEAIVDHDTSSRLDLLVEITTEQGFEWIAFESKLGSSEMSGQLRRYAELLDSYSAIRRGTLVFITREYEPKDADAILERVSREKVFFLQRQWRDFYVFLQRQPKDAYLAEVLDLMKELGMAQSSQFTATDILALSSLHKVYSLMQATLNDEVKQAIRAATGTEPRLTDVSALRHSRYFLWIWPTQEWWAGIGFSFPPTEEYPALRLQVEVSARANPVARQALIAAMKEIASGPGWHGYNLSAAREWSGVLYDHNLRHILTHDDHVAACRQQCLAYAHELGRIKQRFPELPWNKGAAQASPGTME